MQFNYKRKGGIGTRLTNLCICYAMFKDYVPFYQSDVHLKLEHQTCLYTVDVLITAKPYLRGFVSGYKIPRTFLYLTRKNENWISTVGLGTVAHRRSNCSCQRLFSVSHLTDYMYVVYRNSNTPKNSKLWRPKEKEIVIFNKNEHFNHLYFNT